MNNTLGYPGIPFPHPVYDPSSNNRNEITNNASSRIPYASRTLPLMSPSSHSYSPQYFPPAAESMQPGKLYQNTYIDSSPISLPPPYSPFYHSHYPSSSTQYNAPPSPYQHTNAPSTSQHHVDHSIYSSYNSSLVPYYTPSPISQPVPYRQFPHEEDQANCVDSILVENMRDVHFSYLTTDDSPEKLELWKKMDELIQIFVSLTSDSMKYSFHGVRDVITSSVHNKEDFDGFKAAEAFEALASYAANLIIHPWRREYKTLKLYSGYWVHKVSQHLSSADTILRLIGYVPIGYPKGAKDPENVSCYQLPNSSLDIDRDAVARLALDCHIAGAECQILGKLHQEFSQLDYMKLLQYRRMIKGSYEDTALSLFNVLNAKSPALMQNSNECKSKDISPDSQTLNQRAGHQIPVKSKGLIKQSTSKGSLIDDEMKKNADKLMLTAPRYQARKPLVGPPTTSLSDSRVMEKYSSEDVKPPVIRRYKKLPMPLPTSQFQERPAIEANCTSFKESSKKFDKQYSNSYEEDKGKKKILRQEQKPRFPDVKRKTEERMIPISLEERDVTMEKLIDHSVEENRQLGSTLPKVLPQYSRSSKSTQGDKILPDVISRGSGKTYDDTFYSMSTSIPSEMFQRKQTTEHITDSYNQLKEKKRAQSNQSNYRDSWGFVFSDLEKKGYSKDVGNRGDILNTVTDSKVSLSNDVTDGKTSEGKGGYPPDCIPRTVLSVSKKNRGEMTHAKNMQQVTDAFDSLSHERKERKRSSRSGGSAETLNGKQSNSSTNRKSVYDNLSYGGFETACQDSEEDDFNDHNFKTTREELPPKYTRNPSPEPAPKALKEGSPKLAMPWNCASCTFKNESHPTVCEICSKSRQTLNSAPIKPLVTGSLQCPTCTLINEKGNTVCTACDTPLEACATYI